MKNFVFLASIVILVTFRLAIGHEEGYSNILGSTPTEILTVLVLFFLNAQNLWTSMMFLFCAVLDSKRTLFMTKFCLNMIKEDVSPWKGLAKKTYKKYIKPTNKTIPEGESWALDTIDLTDPKTVFLWFKIREVTADFGLMFKRRMHSFMGVVLMGSITLFASILYMRLRDPAMQAN